MEKSKDPHRSGRQAVAIPVLLILAGACLIFGGDLLAGSDFFFKAVRDPNPYIASYPWYMLHRQALSEGLFPLWNPWNGAGAPLLANYQSGFFSPFLAPLFLLPIGLISAPYFIIRLILAGLGAALYFRRLGLGLQACTFGAVAFALSGWMIQYVNNQHLVIDMLIPYILLFMEKIRSEYRFRDTLALAALLALVLLGGQPGSALFTLGFAGAYGMTAAWKQPRAVALFSAAGLLALILTLVQLFPFFELISQGWSAHLSDWSSQQLRLSEIITLIAPGFYGFTSDNRVPIMQQLPYLGVAAAVLCLTAFFHFGSLPRQGRVFIIAALISLGFLHGLPVFSQIMSAPGLSQISFIKYIQPVLFFSAVAAAAIAMDRAQTPNRGIIMTACIIIFFLVWQRERSPDAGTFAAVSSMLVFIQLAAFRIFFRKKWALVILAFAGLVADSKFNRPEYFFNPEKHDFSFLERFESRPQEFFRTAATPDVLNPNYSGLRGVSELRLNEVLFVKRHIEYIMAVNHQTPEQMRRYILPYSHSNIRPEPDYFRSALASRAGLKWFVSREPIPPNRTIEKILDSARVLAPGSGHTLKKTFEIGGDKRPALFQHPPCLITIPAQGQTGRPVLMASIALDPASWAGEGDGVWAVMLENENMVYSRYIDPKNNDGERRWIPFEILKPSNGELRLCTLPGDNQFNDWFGWGDLRRGEQGPLEPGIQDGFRVFINDNAFPRAFFAESVTWVSGPEAGKSLLSSLGHEKKVIMEEPTPAEVKKYSSGQVQSISMDLDRLRLEVNSEGEAALVIANTYFPGWKAFLDGEETRIYPADHAFQGVIIPGGGHILELRYRPIAFRTGLWASIVSLIFLFAILPSSLIFREAWGRPWCISRSAPCRRTP